jgi:hypothetical protein
MSNSISAINSNQNINQLGSQVNFKQVKADFQNLTQALQSGNITAARQAFAALQKDSPQIAQALSQSGQNSSNPQSSALQALSTALQSGNVADAQKALASLQQAHKGHHHHHGGAAQAGTTAATGNSSDVGLYGDIGTGSSSTSSFNAIA